jgi:hypothetical protein
MSTFMKKNDDETWAEWTKRVPDINEDKLDYIGETIYAKICKYDKEKAGKITGMLLEMDVDDLIVLLESDELLDAQIEEAYQILREDEEIKMSDEEVLSSEEACRVANEACRVANEACRVLNEECRVANEACRVANEAYKEEKSRAENEKEEEIELVKYTALEPDKEDAEEVSWPGSDDYDDEYGYYNRNGGDYKRPVVTITVADMIEALSKLPTDAKLVMTESGYYSRREFARILLPQPYIVGTNKMNETDLPKGTQVYCIGHSHQMY